MEAPPGTSLAFTACKRSKRKWMRTYLIPSCGTDPVTGNGTPADKDVRHEKVNREKRPSDFLIFFLCHHVLFSSYFSRSLGSSPRVDSTFFCHLLSSSLLLILVFFSFLRVSAFLRSVVPSRPLFCHLFVSFVCVISSGVFLLLLLDEVQTQDERDDLASFSPWFVFFSPLFIHSFFSLLSALLFFSFFSFSGLGPLEDLSSSSLC